MDELDLDAIQARADAAHAEVVALCAGKRWTMQIPARPDKDSDLVISASLADIPALHLVVQRLRAENARLRIVNRVLSMPPADLAKLGAEAAS